MVSVRSSTDGASSPQSTDLEREEFPGGDAMLEVLTRLQSYQESMQMQLEVRGVAYVMVGHLGGCVVSR